MKFFFLLAVISAIGVAADDQLPPYCSGFHERVFTHECWELYNEEEKQARIEYLDEGYPECKGIHAGRELVCREILWARSRLNASDPDYEYAYPNCNGPTSRIGVACIAIYYARDKIFAIKKELGINVYAVTETEINTFTP